MPPARILSDDSMFGALGAGAAMARSTAALPTFAEVYRTYAQFLWRSLHRLGVETSLLEDATQEVFLVVHRRLGEFEGRSSLRTWLFGIALRVAREYRRRASRGGSLAGAGEPDAVCDPAPGPHETALQSEAVRTLHELLDALDQEKREVFVLAELEELTGPEIAEVLGLNLNTAYARLRAAREDFERAVARHRRREAR